jgi:AAA family ATP:ADP antiporter
LQGRLQQVLNVHRGEWGLLAAFFVLIALNTAALEGADVVATSSYLERPGPATIPPLWIADMVVILISSLLYSLVADRFPRLTLLRGLMVGFGVTMLLLRLLISYGLPDVISHTLLYVLVDQQLILFPLAFWAFANDSYNVAASKRLFPLISAGGLIGNVAGNWFAGQSAAIFVRRGLPNDDLLTACSLIFFAALGILAFAFRSSHPHLPPKVGGDRGGAAPTPGPSPNSEGEESFPPNFGGDRGGAAPAAGKINLRETWEVGVGFVRNVPLFRYLALVLFCNEIVMTVVEFHFLAQTVEQFDAVQFQAFYGSFKALLTIASLVVQFFLAGRLLERIGLKNAFFPLPATLVVGSLAAAVHHDVASAVGVRFGARLVLDSLDDPSRKSVQGLVPDARRGRVSTFLDSYVYATGTIAGCLLLGLSLLLGRIGVIGRVAVVVLYESLAAVMAAVTFFFASRLRAVYEDSLWNPWLARRKRRGISIELDL